MDDIFIGVSLLSIYMVSIPKKNGQKSPIDTFEHRLISLLFVVIIVIYLTLKKIFDF